MGRIEDEILGGQGNTHGHKPGAITADLLTHPSPAPSSLHSRAGGAGPGCDTRAIPTVMWG